MQNWRLDPVGLAKPSESRGLTRTQSGFGLRRHSWSGGWTCLELNQPVFPVRTWTTGRCPGPVANTSYMVAFGQIRCGGKLYLLWQVVSTCAHTICTRPWSKKWWSMGKLITQKNRKAKNNQMITILQIQVAILYQPIFSVWKHSTQFLLISTCQLLRHRTGNQVEYLWVVPCRRRLWSESPGW